MPWRTAIGELMNDDAATAAEAKGRSARERVVAEFSWQRHCEQLERILLEIQ